MKNNNANSTDYYAKYIGEINETINTIKQINIKDLDRENKLFEGLIKLKKLGSDINNFLTMKLSLHFCDWLIKKGIITDSEKIKDKIKKTSPNSSGYDVQYENSTKLLAEVKCVVPFQDNNEFGSNQKKSIMNDINNLVNGKNKLKGKTCGYYKFLVLYNDEKGKTENAIEQLLKIIIDAEETKKEERETDPVYTVLLNPDIQELKLLKKLSITFSFIFSDLRSILILSDDFIR